MSDPVQMIIVTTLAAAALLVLLRPLFARGKDGARPRAGCESCGASEAHRTQVGSGGRGR